MKRKKLAQHHLTTRQASLCHRQTDDGQKQVLLCPHLVAKSGHSVGPDRDAGCWHYHHRWPWMRLWVVTNDITRARCDKLTLQLVHFILEYVEVVGRCHRNDVVLGMPGSVQDLLIEVQTIHADFILFAFAACAHLAGLQDLHGLAVFTGRLQCHVPSVAAIEHPEEVVIWAGHHHTAQSRWGDVGKVRVIKSSYPKTMSIRK